MAAIDTSSVRRIFTTCEYEIMEQQSEWIEEAGLFDQLDNDFVDALNTDQEWMQSMEQTQRKNILKGIASEIANSGKAVAAAEEMRGINSEDTLKYVVPLIKDFFEGCSVLRLLQCDDDAVKPYGLCKVIFEDDSPLWLFAFIVAPALAAGNRLVLCTPSKLAPSIRSLVDACRRAGVPETVLALLPYTPDEDPTEVLDIAKVVRAEKSTMAYPTRLGNTIYNVGKSTMIAFGDADLDSLCDKALEAAWRCQGKLPWSVSRLLVQENIYQQVVDKLKSRIDKHLGHFDNVSDIDQFLKIVKDATDMGVEVYPELGGDEDAISPAMLIGGPGAITMEDLDTAMVPFFVVQSFRTTEEAAALANNTTAGFCASIWTESMAKANEVAQKIKFSVIWMNSHGKLCPYFSTRPYKESGSTFIGGMESILQYQLPLEENEPLIDEDQATRHSLNKQILETYVQSAKKGFAAWSKVDVFKRLSILVEFAEDLELCTSFNENEQELATKVGDNFRKWSMVSDEFAACNLLRPTLDATLHEEPLGVLLFLPGDVYLEHICAAIAHGNAVIVMTTDSNTDGYFTFLLKVSNLLPKEIPSGVLNVYKVEALEEDSAYVLDFDCEVERFYGDGHTRVISTLAHKLSNYGPGTAAKRAFTRRKVIYHNVKDTL